MLVCFWFQLISLDYSRSFHPFPHGTFVLYAYLEDHFGLLRKVPHKFKQSNESSFYINHPSKKNTTGVGPALHFIFFYISTICFRSPLLTKSRLIYSLFVTEMFHFTKGLECLVFVPYNKSITLRFPYWCKSNLKNRFK